MSFLFDKPLIVRLVEILLAILGVVMIYAGYLNLNDASFAAISFVIGIMCIVCGTLVRLRRWYAWHFTLAMLLIFSVYFVVAYIETSDMLWICGLLMTAMISISWIVRVTRTWFDSGFVRI